jgi:prepilin-type processing-associated H-X9-DG protein/prepilin-type N-terminal cleavage/methylation domain-containing protein
MLRAFTLVELLVVVGIIALLIGILMPALARARQTASRTSCLSNLHNIGLAVTMYTGEWKGKLPEGMGPDGLVTWVSLLANEIGASRTAKTLHTADMGTADTNKALNMFLCGDAAPFRPTPPNHYSAHPLLMPDMSTNYPAAFPEAALQGKQRVPYRITRIPNPHQIILVFDGTQAMGGNGSANFEGNYIDCNRISGANLTPTNPGVTYLIAGYNNVDLGRSVDGGLNKDGPPTTNTCNVRWRHMGNTSANFLFVDGHAGSLRYNSEFSTELLRRNVYVPVP